MKKVKYGTNRHKAFDRIASSHTWRVKLARTKPGTEIWTFAIRAGGIHEDKKQQCDFLCFYKLLAKVWIEHCP